MVTSTMTTSTVGTMALQLIIPGQLMAITPRWALGMTSLRATTATEPIRMSYMQIQLITMEVLMLGANTALTDTMPIKQAMMNNMVMRTTMRMVTKEQRRQEKPSEDVAWRVHRFAECRQVEEQQQGQPPQSQQSQPGQQQQPSFFPPPFVRGAPAAGRGGFVPPSFRGTRGFPPTRGAYPPFRGGYPGAYPPGYPPGYAPPQTTPVVDQATRLKKLANCEEDEELWVEAESPEGKPYFYHWQTRETVWDRPEKAKVVGQTELAELIQKASEEERKEREVLPSSVQRVTTDRLEYKKKRHNGMLPLMHKGHKQVCTCVLFVIVENVRLVLDSALKVIFSGFMPPPFFPPGFPMPGGRQPMVSTNPDEAWNEYTAPDGRKYYYNSITQENTWDKPQVLIDKESGKSPMDTSSPAPQAAAPVVPVATAGATGMQPDAIAEAQAKAQAALAEYLAQSKNQAQQQHQQQQKKAEEKKDNTRPISSTPVSGTAWCVVWTGDGKVFFYNPSTKTSVWERPPEMYGRADVDALVTKCPEVKKDEPEQQNADADSDGSEEEGEDGGPPKKKSRSERKKEALLAQQKKEKVKPVEAKEKFQELLKEAELHGKSSFSSFGSKFGKDPRFKAVEKMRDREDLFNEYVGELHKKEKEERREKKEKAKKEYLAMLAEQTSFTRKTKWSTAKKLLENDERFKAVESSSSREQMFRDHVEKLGDESLSDIEEEAEREKRLAADAAIAARQREVEAELGDKLRERDLESERHRMQEHQERFNALLVDLVKSAEANWHETRRILRKDERYAECDLLDKEKKESAFNEHIRNLEKKRRDAFFAVLDEHPKITTQTRWKEARRIIQDEEETFSKVASNSERKVERDYRDWQELRHDNAVREFKDLLKETKIITYKSKRMIEENEQHLKDILAVLENDKRWMRMSENHASERDRILDEYIEVLHRKGTPPPPTQQERERRRKETA
ncbi:FF domain protein [Ancylostoma caninum]|uniref:FF domain protein n=1 Tax=Ancylostoma caninum TaxID=29170 RepID=A0A368FR64_ANCCA|nr:FF domain protein [Ancylostoma caninum]